MMNGLLMSSDYAPISIDPKDEVAYRSLLIGYYETEEKADFRDFLLTQQQKVLARFHIDDPAIIRQSIQSGSTIPYGSGSSSEEDIGFQR